MNFRSAPAQKARPLPVKTMERTSGSSVARVRRASSVSSSCLPRLFSCSGRFRVSQAAAPRFS